MSFHKQSISSKTCFPIIIKIFNFHSFFLNLKNNNDSIKKYPTRLFPRICGYEKKVKQLLRENAINKRTCYPDNPHKIGDIVKPIDTDAAITGCIDYPVFIS